MNLCMPAAVRSPVPVSARLARAMALSLLLHGVLLSLRFGIPGIGLPSLEVPWRELRAQSDLRITISGARAAAEAAPPADVPGLKLYSEPKPARSQRAAPPDNAKETAPAAVKRRTRPRREQPVIALAEPQTKSFAVPAPALEETASEGAPPEPDAQAAQSVAALQAKEAAASRGAERQARERTEEEARRLEQERAAHLAREQREMQQAEAQRRELAERLALEGQMRRQEEEAALALESQQEEIRRHEREQAAQRALELEAQRTEEARRAETARLAREAAEREARKEEAARRQAALERQRQEEQLAARRKAEEDAASLRTREAAAMSVERPATALPRDLTGGLASRALEQARAPDAIDAPRRHSVFGKVDRDVGLMMYVESWRLKVERNGNLNYRQSSADKARGDPLVTVAIRSDGSVDDIVIHRSSGRYELDEAVRRIVRINARYSAFPPELARRFDVIEIRRIWNFDDGLRIIEEVR
jgi:TonB family protein